MTTQPSRFRQFGRQIRSFTDTFGGVASCAAAAEAGKRPSRSALKAAGIDADAFYGISQG
ncbi:hypothetical protein [Aureimonas sp. AU12]|uniref:hypothetical protein n=1 Tax=Aureimonas sp. AU12 TaxID=1638161 RepID=UPI0007849E16|nr:hypothetical protein [Aureimonas sp. AU12]